MSNTRNASELYLNGQRVAELWAAIQAALSKKAESSALEGYMTAEDVNSAITEALSGVSGLRFEAVDALPETGENNVIYLVPDGADSEVRVQNMWLGGKWVTLGRTSVDLAGHWSKEELRAMTAEELQAILK